MQRSQTSSVNLADTQGDKGDRLNGELHTAINTIYGFKQQTGLSMEGVIILLRLHETGNFPASKNELAPQFQCWRDALGKDFPENYFSFVPDGRSRRIKLSALGNRAAKRLLDRVRIHF